MDFSSSMNPLIDRSKFMSNCHISVLIETTTLSEIELTDYCRKMELSVNQVKEWRAISIQINKMGRTGSCYTKKEFHEAKVRLRELESELLRKDNPLTNTATLLMLREKINTFWDCNEKN